MIRLCSLFSGVGGFELGFMQAYGRENVEIVFACDNDKWCKQTYLKHFNPSVWANDIKAVDPQIIPEDDILTAGFPCQSFSIAGKRKGWNDTRGTLFFEICRILGITRSKIILLENVKGLLNHDKGRTFRIVIESLVELGYDCEWQVLNTSWFLPQNRERVFIVGHLGGRST